MAIATDIARWQTGQPLGATTLRGLHIEEVIGSSAAIDLLAITAFTSATANPFAPDRPLAAWIADAESASAAIGKPHLPQEVLVGFGDGLGVGLLAEHLTSPRCQPWLSSMRRSGQPTKVEAMVDQRFGSWMAMVDILAAGDAERFRTSLFAGEDAEVEVAMARLVQAAYMVFRLGALSRPDLGRAIVNRHAAKQQKQRESNLALLQERILPLPRSPLVESLFDVCIVGSEAYSIERHDLGEAVGDLIGARRTTAHGVTVTYAAKSNDMPREETGDANPKDPQSQAVIDANLLGHVCRFARSVLSYGYSGDFVVAILAILWERIQRSTDPRASGMRHRITWAEIDQVAGFTARGLTPRAIREIRTRLTLFGRVVSSTMMSVSADDVTYSDQLFTMTGAVTLSTRVGGDSVLSGQFESANFTLGEVLTGPLFDSPDFSLACYDDLLRAGDIPVDGGRTMLRMRAQWLLASIFARANEAIYRADTSGRANADYDGVDWFEHAGVPVIAMAAAEVEAATGFRLTLREVEIVGEARVQAQKDASQRVRRDRQHLVAIFGRLRATGAIRDWAQIGDDQFRVRPSDRLVRANRVRARQPWLDQQAT